MYGTEEIKRMNSCKIKRQSSKNGEPFADSVKPEMMTPYKAAARFYPAIPEQLPVVTYFNGFEIVDEFVVGKFGCDRPDVAGPEKLRSWIRETVLKVSNPYIGVIANGSDSVTVALFNKVAV